MLVSKIKLKKCFLALFILMSFSLLLLNYQGGDFAYYKEYYHRSRQFGLVDGYYFFRSFIGGIEPGYYFLAKISSIFLPYVAFKIVIAAIYCALFIKLASRRHLLLQSVYFITNFYILALITELERLSLALAVLALILIYYKKSTLRLFLFPAVFHVQATMLSAFLIVREIKSAVKDAFYAAPAIIIAAIFIFLYLDPFITLLTYLNNKILHYSSSADVFNSVAKLTAISFILIFTSWRIAFAVFCLLMLPAIVIGVDRALIFIFLWSLFEVLQKPYLSRQNWPHHLLCCYASLKGFGFLLNFIMTGRGYLVG
jgi:hypothetical protein